MPAGFPGPLHRAARGGPAPAPPRVKRVFRHRTHAQLLPGAVTGTSQGAADPVESYRGRAQRLPQCHSFILSDTPSLRRHHLLVGAYPLYGSTHHSCFHLPAKLNGACILTLTC